MEHAGIERTLILEFEHSERTVAVREEVVDIVIIPNPIDPLVVSGAITGAKRGLDLFRDRFRVGPGDRHIRGPIDFREGMFDGIDMEEQVAVHIPELRSEAYRIARIEIAHDDRPFGQTRIDGGIPASDRKRLRSNGRYRNARERQEDCGK